MNRINGNNMIDTILNIIFSFFLCVGKIIRWIFSKTWKFILDVLNNVYGRIVVIIGGAIVLTILNNFNDFFHK